MSPLSLTARARAVACAVAMASLWSTSVSSAQPETQLRSFHLGALRGLVFPLFTALGERAWAPGWDPVLLAGAEERGSAFRTKNHHGQETVWIVIDYRPAEGRVSYARLAYGSNIGLVDVVCTEPPAGGTDVSVRYTLTALSEEARSFVRDFLNPEHYSQMMEEWRAALNSLVSRSAPTQ